MPHTYRRVCASCKAIVHIPVERPTRLSCQSCGQSFDLTLTPSATEPASAVSPSAPRQTNVPAPVAAVVIVAAAIFFGFLIVNKYESEDPCERSAREAAGQISDIAIQGGTLDGSVLGNIQSEDDFVATFCD